VRLFVALVLALFGASVWQFSKTLPGAERGLVLYAREQKDLFVDTQLIRESYRVHPVGGLEQRLRDETVIVGTRTSEHTAYVGAGVILGMHEGLLEILTAKHIIAHRGRKFVIFPDHSIRHVQRIVPSGRSDLAAVFVQPVPFSSYPSVRLARETFANGQAFVVMGHPGAKSWTASPGVAERHLHTTLLFCPTCERGDSGAGAFDRTGALHGIIVTKSIISAPSAQSWQYVKLVAFEMEPPQAIRSFLQGVK
jgi:hypothetical protein